MSTREKIEVMQAFEDGKEIEICFKGMDDWQDCPNPAWDWNICEYRVKEEQEQDDFWEHGEPCELGWYLVWCKKDNFDFYTTLYFMSLNHWQSLNKGYKTLGWKKIPERRVRKNENK